jgi:glycosyltransferase involved in cell wall biosynthesis
MNAELDRRFSLNLAGAVIEENILLALKHYDFVTYHGLLTKEQIAALYKKNDIFALISIHETFGLVYPEAMTQGSPIVYTKGQGIDGYFPDGDVGYPVSPFSYDEFKDSILKILSDYKNFSKRCILGSKFFSWNNISGLYQKIYQEMNGY